MPTADPLFSLAGKTALVTGGGSGIGAMIAAGLVRRGVRTYITGRDPAAIADFAGQLAQGGGQCIGLAAELAGDDGAARLAAQVAERGPALHVLVNNAGANAGGILAETTPAEWDLTIRVNLRGSYLTIHHAVPLMKKKGGSIVLISSINGTRTFTTAGATAYSATKAAQFAMGKMLALELARHKIRVNVICPGAIKTRLGENTWRRNQEAARVPAKFPEGTIPLTKGVSGEAEDIAKTVVFLSSDAARHITGTPIFVDGGQSLLI